MKVIKVGTTFLSQSKHGYAAQQHDKIQAHTKVDIHKQYNDRRPIVTPYIDVVKNDSSISNTVNENSTSGLQQYLLIPNSDHIQVLSSDNGQCILKLLLSNNTTNTKKQKYSKYAD